MMFIQISSGQGPVECQRVVWLLYKKLISQFTDLELVDCENGFDKNCYKSMTLLCKDEEVIAELKENWQGSIQWRGQSPFRPAHKRKNWFVKVSLISVEKSELFDPSKVEFSAFRGGGPGGQHVNKTSTAIRAVYLPSGEAVTCSDQRSQFQNRQVALLRLMQKLDQANSNQEKKHEAEYRMLHYQLERGNPVQSFSGKL